MTDVDTPTPAAATARGSRRDARRSQRGQVIVIFAGAMIALIALCAVVVDVAWYWTVSQRMQRAADAAALAGVVWLPGDPTTAYKAAKAEATKNGFQDGIAGVKVSPVQDPVNKRRLKVSITGPIGTFFARVVGLNSFPGKRDAKADYALPVPMGSPENYYGVFGMTRGLTSTTTVLQDQVASSTVNSGWMAATATPSNVWSANTGTVITAVQGADAAYAFTTTTNSAQQWSSFGLTNGLAGNQVITSVQGLEVRLTNFLVSAGCSSTFINVAVSWDGGTTWTTSTNRTPALTTSNQTATFGSSSSLSAWTTHTWVPGDIANNKFLVRLTSTKGCGTSGLQIRDNMLDVRATYRVDTTTQVPVTTTTNLPDQLLHGPGTTCTTGTPSCYEADGASLNPRGFWGTLNTEGAENVNGDAFQPYYDTATGTAAPSCATVDPGTRACYDGVNYYNYGVEIPAGATNASVYVYDPGHCSVAVAKGTGDRWFSGTTAVSTFYELYDMNDTAYDLSDDTLVSTSGSLFRRIQASDTSMGGASGVTNDCRYHTDTRYNDGRDYHDRWFRLASGLSGGANGHVYRLHTTSTDPSNGADQRSTNGENSFAIYASATGGSPKVYGLGAMQAFTPLTGSGSGTVSSEFYLAQIEAVHAGKTIEIHLWDPGDTNPLNAKLQILIPTTDTTWTPTPFSYTASQGTSNSGRAACSSQSGTGVSQVETNVGATTGTFNGCWLVLRAVIPANYTGAADGWWKIRYNMSGSGTSNDVTTWTVNIVGNPVHLVLP